MKTKLRLTVTGFLVLFSCLPYSSAQYAAHTQWNLPEGAKARLGKGVLHGKPAYSPDGTRLALASSIGIWILDGHTGKELALFTGHTDSVHSVAYSPDGKTLATTGEDKTVCLWDAATGSPKSVLTGHSGMVTDVAYSPDGKTLASVSRDKTVRLWDAATGSPKSVLTGHSGMVTDVAYSPDGKTLATASWDGMVRLWDAATGSPKLVITSPTNKILYHHVQKIYIDHTFNGFYDVAYSPDGKTLATASRFGMVRLWDAATGEHKVTCEQAYGWKALPVFSVAYSPDGKTLVRADSDGMVRLWDVATGEYKAVLSKVVDRSRNNRSDPVRGVAYSPDSTTIATVYSSGIFCLWGTDTQKPITLLTEYSEHIGLAEKVDRLGVSRDDGSTLRVPPFFDSNSSIVNILAYSPDGLTLAAGYADFRSLKQWGSKVRLWDAATGKLKAMLTNDGVASEWYGVARLGYSPDGLTLATVNEEAWGSPKVRLWDVATGKLKGHLTGYPGWVRRLTYVLRDWSVAYSPDGLTLATVLHPVRLLSDGLTLASVEPTNLHPVRLLDAATGQHLADLSNTSGVISLAYSPDGSTLVTGYARGMICLWDAATGKPKATLTGHTAKITSVAYSPDGSTLASASEDSTVRFWDTATGEHKATFTRHAGPVYSVAYSPDGKTLAIGNREGLVFLWDLTQVMKSSQLLEGESNHDSP